MTDDRAVRLALLAAHWRARAEAAEAELRSMKRDQPPGDHERELDTYVQLCGPVQVKVIEGDDPP